MPCPLVIDSLVKKYGSHAAVDGVSFSIEPGEVFGLLGPNGAGKTTIISTLMTLQEPTSGEIRIFGRSPNDAKSLVGFVPQELVHHGFFTVEQILRYHLSYFGIPDDPGYREYLLKKLHLYSQRKKLVSQLSGGMKRRVMIAKSLLHHPKLLLLDEPTAGVDVELRTSLWEFIEELKKDNISILLTTHYLEEAELLCDRVGILQDGKLRRIDRVENLIEKYASKKISLVLKNPLPPISHVFLTEQKELKLHFKVPQTMMLSQFLAETLIPHDQIHDIMIEQGSLEEVMEEVLK